MSQELTNACLGKSWNLPGAFVHTFSLNFQSTHYGFKIDDTKILCSQFIFKIYFIRISDDD